MSHKPNGDGDYSLEWLSMDEACEYTKHSAAAIKRWVAAGKIEKKLVPMPGARPRVRLLRRDLNRLFNPVSSPVEVSSVSQARAKPEKTEQTDPNTALVPTAEEAVKALSSPLLRLVETLERRAQSDQLNAKLCWSMREAREMTGLSRPALRELAEAHPDCAIRRGRRTWLLAGKLRGILA